MRRAVPLYWTSFLVVGLSLSMLGPALSELRDRSGADIGDIGVLFVGQAAGYIIGSFLGGRLYDRLDGHRLYAASLLTLGAGLALVPAFDDLRALFVVVVVTGVGAATGDVGANAMLMWELGDRSSRALNVLHLCFGLGALSAPLFVYLSLDATMYGAAITCVVLAAWTLSVPAPRVRVATPDQHASPSARLLALLATFFLLYVGLEVGFAGWIFTYGEEIELSEFAATWLTTTFWIGFTVGRLLASAFAHLVRPKVVLAVAATATAASAGILLIGRGAPVAVWTGTALIGLAAAPQFPTMLAYLERRVHVTGYATSWFIGAAGLGGLVFPWLIGRWFDASGAWALPAATLLLALAVLGAFATSDRVLGEPRRDRAAELIDIEPNR